MCQVVIEETNRGSNIAMINSNEKAVTLLQKLQETMKYFLETLNKKENECTKYMKDEIFVIIATGN